MFDARIRPNWPQEVLDALDDVRQGDVIPWPADTAYITTDRFVLYGDPLAEGEPSGELFAVALEPAPRLAVITSQTCDIDEQGIPRRKPWVQYAPLVERAQAPAKGLNTWPLDGPELPDGEWYADLRIEGSIEKNALVGMTPIRGFATEAEANRFGMHLGHLRARPALSNHLIETVTEHLRQFRKNATRGTRNQLKAGVVEVRLDIQDGTRMEPHAVRLVVLHNGKPNELIRTWFGAWWDDARPVAATAGIELHPILHVDALALDYPSIKDLIVLDLAG